MTASRRPPANPTPRLASRRPRTVDAALVPEVDGPASALAAGAGRAAPAMSGLWAMLQGMVLSYLVVLLLSMVALLATPADGGTGVPWAPAAMTAGGAWLLGHGVPLVVDEVPFTLVPLGVTALSLFTAYISAKRSAHRRVSAVVVAAVFYAMVTTLGAVVAEVRGAGLGFALLGGGLVGGSAAALGVLSRPTSPRLADLLPAWWWRIPTAVRQGARGGLLACWMLCALAGLVVVAWTVQGYDTSAAVFEALNPGWLGGIVLAVTQLALLPNLVVWAMAWLAGPGFAVGQGTVFSPGQVLAGPMPALPLLGSLPGGDWTTATGGDAGAEAAAASAAPLVAALAPVAVAACGAVAGWCLWRRLDRVPMDRRPGGEWVRWGSVCVAAPMAAATAGLTAGFAQGVAAGAVGAGRLSLVGADAVAVAAWTSLWMLVGALVFLVTARIVRRPPRMDPLPVGERAAALAARIGIK